MTQRPPHDDDGRSALWHEKLSPGMVDSQSVVVAHADVQVGESIALLLRMKGFVAIATSTMEQLELMIEYWRPRALLLDTCLCHADDFRFIRHAAEDAAFRSVLIITMTNICPAESPQEMRRIGFDGLMPQAMSSLETCGRA
jgi:DNA-binding response OmpR family regulator